jgi:hypothetical protein
MYNVKSIVQKLREIFGNKMIYRENQTSGFKDDSFFIPSIEAESKGELSFSNRVTMHCQIIYFPRRDHINDDIESVQLQLITDFLTVGGQDVFNRNFAKSDDALVFTFDFISFVFPKNATNDLGQPLNNLQCEGRWNDERR